jgi:hypothetical protein
LPALSATFVLIKERITRHSTLTTELYKSRTSRN